MPKKNDGGSLIPAVIRARMEEIEMKISKEMISSMKAGIYMAHPKPNDPWPFGTVIHHRRFGYAMLIAARELEDSVKAISLNEKDAGQVMTIGLPGLGEWSKVEGPYATGGPVRRAVPWA